ncbi:hypothetical protein, partial [Bradyrhizobium japonicum]|uniref:hypothetical protein n=3 Tax=Bradyrhizobium TaxID=374 RepID=UPI001AEC26FC
PLKLLSEFAGPALVVAWLLVDAGDLYVWHFPSRCSAFHRKQLQRERNNQLVAEREAWSLSV